MPWLLRDALEVAMVVAVGGMLWSVVGRLRRGDLSPFRCRSCGRAVSRAYGRCPGCGSSTGLS